MTRAAGFGELGAQLDKEQESAEEALILLLLLLRRGVPDALARAERVLRVGVYDAFTLGARTQLRELRSYGRSDQRLISDLAESQAVTLAALLTQNTATVVPGSSDAQVTAYGKLITQLATMTGVRAGIDAAALDLSGVPVVKEFIRIRGAREPRSHSRYEGTRRPVNGTWLIAGVAAQRPGDPRLPLSETIRCGHGVKYVRAEQEAS